MTRVQRYDAKENPYEKIFDDAGRALKDLGELDGLDELPKLSKNDTVSVPFPYGPQPESRKPWK